MLQLQQPQEQYVGLHHSSNWYKHQFQNILKNLGRFANLIFYESQQTIKIFNIVQCRYVEYLSESLTGCSLQP